jgi:hypothetical protein
MKNIWDKSLEIFIFLFMLLALLMLLIEFYILGSMLYDIAHGKIMSYIYDHRKANSVYLVTFEAYPYIIPGEKK